MEDMRTVGIIDFGRPTRDYVPVLKLAQPIIDPKNCLVVMRWTNLSMLALCAVQYIQHSVISFALQKMIR